MELKFKQFLLMFEGGAAIVSAPDNESHPGGPLNPPTPVMTQSTTNQSPFPLNQKTNKILFGKHLRGTKDVCFYVNGGGRVCLPFDKWKEMHPRPENGSKVNLDFYQFPDKHQKGGNRSLKSISVIGPTTN